MNLSKLINSEIEIATRQIEYSEKGLRMELSNAYPCATYVTEKQNLIKRHKENLAHWTKAKEDLANG